MTSTILWMKIGGRTEFSKWISIRELVTPQILFKIAANLHIMPYIYRHTAPFSYLHRYVLSLTLRPIFIVENIWRSKAVSTPLQDPNSPHTIPQHPIPTPTSLKMSIMSSCLYFTVLSHIITISCSRRVCGGGGCGVCGCSGALGRGGCGGGGGGDGCD